MPTVSRPGWCGPCQEALPFVRSAFAKYGERVRFVGVDVLEDDGAARATISRAALPFPVAIYPIDQLDAGLRTLAGMLSANEEEFDSTE